MAKSNLKKLAMTSSLLRPQKRHQTNVTRFFYFKLLSVKVFATPVPFCHKTMVST